MILLSVIIPTYNESENILDVIKSIKHNIPNNIPSEIIIVDDNSPDGTGNIVENYLSKMDNPNERIQNNYNNYISESTNYKDCSVRVVHRPTKSGLISAILEGIDSSRGQNILIMDADFSHPPETIPRLISALLQDPSCIVVASRYINGGSVKGWPFKRRVMSNGATQIARRGLRVCNIKDPMSGFFAFPRHVIENIKVDTKGYKILLEILVKNKDTNVKEIPYTFINRKFGESKLNLNVMTDYFKAVLHLYRYGQRSKSKLTPLIKKEKRMSVLFLSKAGRFFTVGASGLLLNYMLSFLLSNGALANFWYLKATAYGIIISITSNFLLNKTWTFEDKDFSVKHTLRQYGLFIGVSAIGAALQLALVYLLVESGHIEYGPSLFMAVATASVSNFLLNKKLTFHERIWG